MALLLIIWHIWFQINPKTDILLETPKVYPYSKLKHSYTHHGILSHQKHNKPIQCIILNKNYTHILVGLLFYIMLAPVEIKYYIVVLDLVAVPLIMIFTGKTLLTLLDETAKLLKLVHIFSSVVHIMSTWDTTTLITYLVH